MSQNPYAQIGSESGGQFPYGPDLVPSNPGRTSILAIVALVLAVCGCVCPVLVVPGALAMVLGGISIVTMAMENWRIRGIGLAITAICLGAFQCVVVALLFFGIYQPIMGGWRSVVVGPVGHVLTSIDKGDVAGARAGLTPHAQTLISEEMLADFGKRYRAHLGKFVEFPSNPVDIWQTYKRIKPSFRALDDGSGQPNTQNVIPLPGRFEKGEALVIMQLDQSEMPDRHIRSSGGSGVSTTVTPPSTGTTAHNGQWQMPVLNIGIATTDGQVEWLIDPDVARKSGRPPAGAPHKKGRHPQDSNGPPPPDADHRDAAGPDAPSAPPAPPDDKP
jgi:hypothetical protein